MFTELYREEGRWVRRLPVIENEFFEIAVIKDVYGFLLLLGFTTKILKRDITVVTSTIRSLSSFIASVIILIFIEVSKEPRSGSRSVAHILRSEVHYVLNRSDFVGVRIRPTGGR